MSYQRLWELINKKTCQSLMTGGINLPGRNINWIDIGFCDGIFRLRWVVVVVLRETKRKPDSIYFRRYFSFEMSVIDEEHIPVICYTTILFVIFFFFIFHFFNYFHHVVYTLCTWKLTTQIDIETLL